jgi:hypothetical protein
LEEEKTGKSTKTSTRVKWTQVELGELEKYFKKFIDSKITPRAKDCENVRAQSQKKGGQLHRRAAHLIIKKISAINHRKK